MEVIIVLIVLGIVGYLIYQSLSSTKLVKAIQLIDSNNFADASSLLEKIFEKHSDAPGKLAECKLKEGLNLLTNNPDTAVNLFNQVIEIRKRLPANANLKLYKSNESKAYFEISDYKFRCLSTESDTQNKIKSIKAVLQYIDNALKAGIENGFLNLRKKLLLEESKVYFNITKNNFYSILKEVNTVKKIDLINNNINIIDKVPKVGHESSFYDLRKKHIAELAEINYLLGLNAEKINNFFVATNYYTTANKLSIESSSKSLRYNSTARVGICNLKNKSVIKDEIFENVNLSSLDIKNDFYFRLAVRLLKENKYSEADKIISSYLDSGSKIVSQLNQIIHTKKLNEAIIQIDKINTTLDTLYEKSFPIEETNDLYGRLDQLIIKIKPLIPAVEDKLKQLKPSFFNRLLAHYISERKFTQGIDLIQKYPLFWQSPELLKNLGICCFGIVSKGYISELNYRLIISSWLTVIYNDNVILKSIADTSWDDEYTFTLAESIGSNYAQHNTLPDNVNYEEISDSNISIGSTQKELINQFETLLHQKMSDISLSDEIMDFYNNEKMAIEKIVSIITEDILFAGPYFAKTYGINNQVIQCLDDDYTNYDNEASLEAGIPYLKNNSKALVMEYATALELVDNASKAIIDEDLNEFKKIAINPKKSLIGKYETIRSSVEDKLFNSISVIIEEDEENEELIAVIEEAIKFSPTSDKLKYQYSNYVSNYCIGKVNDDKMDNYKALSLRKNAYLYSPNNPKICRNIVTLIRFNLWDILNNETRRTTDIYKVLDDIYTKRSTTFRGCSSELTAERAKVLKDLEKSGVDISLFNGERPIIWGSSQSLNSDGEKLKKVLQYFKKLG